jgi:hypothetical protein
MRSVGGIGGTSWDGATLRSGASTTIASFSPVTNYGGAGHGSRNTSTSVLGNNTGFSSAANGSNFSTPTVGTQNIFGTGGSSLSASGTGNGSGGAGGTIASGNGGAGTAGICRVIVW